MTCCTTTAKWFVLALLVIGYQQAAAVDSVAADAPSWPRFHGPNGDNKSADAGLLTEWPEDGPELLWTAKGVGSGFAGVTLSNGQIYTDGNVGNKTVVTALSLDGKILWQSPVGPAWRQATPGTRGTPTIDGDRVYYESPVGDVACLKASDGEVVWTTNILKEFGAPNITWALSESLLIDGDHVYCTPGGPQTAVVALDKKTGDVAWKSPSADRDSAGYASITLAEYDGVKMLLTMTSKSVIGVNAKDGALLFRYRHDTAHGVNAMMPIYMDGGVFVSTGYGTTGSAKLNLTVDGDKVTAERAWGSREMDNHHGGAVLVDGYVYGSSHNFNGGKWICLDWKTGEMKYAERGVGKGSLTYADGMLYTLNEKSRMGLAKATPEGLELTGEFKLPPGGSGPSWAHPVVCGGRLYIRHGDLLFAYDVKAK